MKVEMATRENFCVGGDSREGLRPDRYGDTKRENALLDHHDPAGIDRAVDPEDQMKAMPSMVNGFLDA